MNKREEISWKFKALIGACGGTCLVMLRLIDANFFIYEEWGTMLGGYLTALGLVVMSTIFTCFVDENNPRKLFTQALLAPSLLIAMVKPGEPVYQGQAATAAEVQTVPTPKPTPTPEGHRAQTTLQMPDAMNEHTVLAGLLLPSTTQARLQAAFTQGSASNEEPRVEPLSRRELGSLTDGALILLGRPKPLRTFIYIVGKTTNERQAKDIATTLKRLLQNIVEVRLRRPEGNQEIFIAIGKFDTHVGASETERIVKERARNISNNPDAKSVLQNGKIVDGRTLFGRP